MRHVMARRRLHAGLAGQMVKYAQNLQCRPLRGERSPVMNRVAAAIALVLATLPLGVAKPTALESRLDISTLRYPGPANPDSIGRNSVTTPLTPRGENLRRWNVVVVPCVLAITQGKRMGRLPTMV